ncbi:MAG: phosphatidate cytidylyltransferase [Leptolyngbyaceae cyanobacterium SL_7_1]|nr:phosphatidate cytidylyltransferase [Leptolyngbyaceae cyanobacterium SL_7_1]
MVNLSLPIDPAPAVWLQITVVVLWLGFVALVAEVLDRISGNPEVVRKAVHIGTGNVILLAWWLQIPAWVGIGASIGFSIVALISYRFPVLPRLDSVGRKSLGTFFYAVSIGVLIAWFWAAHPEYAVLGVLIMTWGDGLAALLGQRWGRHLYKVWGIQKSWEGSAVMALVSFVVTSAVLVAVQGNSGALWLGSVAVALVATGLEAVSTLGIDNLTVPIGSAAIAFWLTLWLDGVG